MMGKPRPRYDSAAILPHWVVGLGIGLLIALGLAMVHLPMAFGETFWLYQLHKSIGITVLLAVVLRVLWRVTHKPPALPASMAPVEKKAAPASHFVLYALMVTVSPLNIPTVLFGVIRWPDMPVFSTLADKTSADAVTMFLYHKLGYVFLALIGIHVAAALRHHFWLRDEVLLRTDYGVGQGVWKTGDYLGLNGDVNFTLAAARSGG